MSPTGQEASTGQIINGMIIMANLSGARIAGIIMAKMKSVVQRAFIRPLTVGSAPMVKGGEVE